MPATASLGPGAARHVTGDPSSSRASGRSALSQSISARSAPPDSTRAGASPSPGTNATAATAARAFFFSRACAFVIGASPVCRFQATRNPRLVATTNSSPSNAEHEGVPSFVSTAESLSAPPSPVRTSSSAATTRDFFGAFRGSVSVSFFVFSFSEKSSSAGASACTHASTVAQLSTSSSGAPRATPSVLNAPLSLPVSSSHTTNARLERAWHAKSFDPGSPRMCAAVTATPSTRRGCSRRTYPRFCPRAMSRHVCTNPSCVAATMVVPSNASAETAAGTVPETSSAETSSAFSSRDTAPTRMVCFSDQSRTSRTRRRALASPSAATRMFLNSAQCWNAPRAGVSGVKETLRTSGGSPSENEDDADAEARAAGGPKPANELARPAAPTIGGNVDVHTTSVTDAPGWYCRETRTRGRGADARVSRGEADGRYALARARSVGRDRRDRTRCQSRHAISRAIAGPTLRRDARGLPGPYLQGRANRVHPRRRIFYDHHLAGHVPLARASGRETKPGAPRTLTEENKTTAMHFGVDMYRRRC